MSGEPLTIFGEGEQTRDYVYVGDVVAANMLASDTLMAEGIGLDTQAFNVGTGSRTSVNQLADMLESIAGNSYGRNHQPDRPGELRDSALNSGRLRKCGWAPAHTVEEGLRETYEYIANQRAGVTE